MIIWKATRKNLKWEEIETKKQNKKNRKGKKFGNNGTFKDNFWNEKSLRVLQFRIELMAQTQSKINFWEEEK